MLIQSGNTQEETRDRCDPPRSQQAVSDSMKSATQRIKTAYLNLKMYEVIAKDNGKTYSKLKKFLEDYENIVEFDVNRMSKMFVGG